MLASITPLFLAWDTSAFFSGIILNGMSFLSQQFRAISTVASEQLLSIRITSKGIFSFSWLEIASKVSSINSWLSQQQIIIETPFWYSMLECHHYCNNWLQLAEQTSFAWVFVFYYRWNKKSRNRCPAKQNIPNINWWWNQFYYTLSQWNQSRINTNMKWMIITGCFNLNKNRQLCE